MGGTELGGSIGTGKTGGIKQDELITGRLKLKERLNECVGRRVNRDRHFLTTASISQIID